MYAARQRKHNNWLPLSIFSMYRDYSSRNAQRSLFLEMVNLCESTEGSISHECCRLTTHINTHRYSSTSLWPRQDPSPVVQSKSACVCESSQSTSWISSPAVHAVSHPQPHSQNTVGSVHMCHLFFIETIVQPL